MTQAIQVRLVLQAAGGRFPEEIELKRQLRPYTQRSPLFQQPVDVSGSLARKTAGASGFRQPAGEKDIFLGFRPGLAVLACNVKGDHCAPGHVRGAGSLPGIGHYFSAILREEVHDYNKIILIKRTNGYSCQAWHILHGISTLIRI
jgi:hypothetical protein